jgi:DNA helicase II / ATP-dependent DNA helicase PcrA
MDLLANLNPQQRLAVQHGRGPALVLAGAGSGKTRVIAHRIAYLVQNGATRPENILAVTFTNKAAAEMRERVHALIGPNRSAEPLISTFHSFCVRLLRREIQHLKYRKDFSIYDSDDQKKLVKQILAESRMSETDFKPREVLSRISYAKNHGIKPEQYAATFRSADSEDIASFFNSYDTRLRQANALDFDDLLLKSVELFERFAELRDYYSDWYRYMLVDEYQDTNRPQYDLLRHLTSKHRNLFVVGDEDQSIYKFRGANIQNILRFEKDFPGAQVIKLEQNYRSTQNILRVAGEVVANNTERKGKTLWTENAAGDIITVRKSLSGRSEALWVADRIRETLEDNPQYKLAVLYRANFLSRNFEDVLTEEGITYAVVGSVAFFGRAEVKDLLAYLRLLFNPEDDIALLRILNTPPRGIGSGTVDILTRTALEKGLPLYHAIPELAASPEVAGRSAKALSRFREMVETWAQIRDTVPVGDLIGRIVQEVQYREMLQKQETAQDAEARMDNIDELIRAASESQERGETVFEFLDRASLSSELDQFDPNARVVLMTLHSAKGLEFDVVFLAGMEEGLFPHSQSMNSKEDLEEERRLCYVGVTRARRKLYLTWTPFRRNFGPDAGMQSIASRFLKEMPADLIEGFEADAGSGYLYEPETEYRRREQEEEARYRRKPEAPQLPGPTSIAELKAYLQKQSSQGKPQKDAAQPGPALKSGTRVRHAQFGEGIILTRERVGNDVKLTITFSRVGRKTLIERYAKLQAI